jgi:cytoskeletal protein CcmA (bactofilin family)
VVSAESTVLEVKRKAATCSHGAAAPARARNVDARANEFRDFQAKMPVITGEIHFKGTLPVDGSLSGQIGVGSSLTLKQRPSVSFATQPELIGEISFKDMVRVNGHVAGTIYSKTGTLIVDVNARVEANIDVATVIIGGTVKGDIVARERVELGPASRIYGNIWTRSLVIKDGAIFEGVCRRLEEEQKAS